MDEEDRGRKREKGEKTGRILYKRKQEIKKGEKMGNVMTKKEKTMEMR